jgi:hypothetical protein
MNTKPYSGVASASQPSLARRSIAAAIAPDRSAAGSRHWHSSTCQCRSHTTTYRGVAAVLKAGKASGPYRGLWPEEARSVYSVPITRRYCIKLRRIGKRKEANEHEIFDSLFDHAAVRLCKAKGSGNPLHYVMLMPVFDCLSHKQRVEVGSRTTCRNSLE